VPSEALLRAAPAGADNTSERLTTCTDGGVTWLLAILAGAQAGVAGPATNSREQIRFLGSKVAFQCDRLPRAHLA
jgi:hypothetical protein